MQILWHRLVFAGSSSCWLGLLNEQSSLLTEEAPVLALLHLVSHACTENCLYNDKGLHGSEMWGLIHGCQICKIRKKQNAELVEMSNYLLEPSVKKWISTSGENTSSLSSISARLSLVFCCTAAKIFFTEIACSKWIHATTFYWYCQKRGVWFVGAFLKKYIVKQSRWPI